MTSNQKILVTTYAPSEPGYTTEVVTGYEWEVTTPHSVLQIYAWKGMARTLVAEYTPGHWRAVRFDRSLISTRQPAVNPALPKGVPVIRDYREEVTHETQETSDSG